MPLAVNDTVKTKLHDDKNAILNKNNYDQLLKDANNEKSYQEDEEGSSSENNKNKSENDEDKANDASDSNKNNKIYGSKEGERYVNSNPMDVIRDLYADNSNIDTGAEKPDQKFIKSLQNVEVDKKYDNAIKKAQKNKKQLTPMKEYKQYSTMLGVPIQNLLENTDKDGKISLSDLNDFFENGPFKKLEDKLVNDLEKKDDKGEPAYTNEQRNFIKKILELMGTIKNNNNFFFDYASVQKNLANIYKNVVFKENNLSLFKKIITAIYNFLSLSNSHVKSQQVLNLAEQTMKDANEFYNVPFNERPMLINKMTKNLAIIKHLLKGIPFIATDKLMKTFKATVKNVEEAKDTKTSSMRVIVDFIKAFGTDSIKHSSINAINENNRKLLLDELVKSITDTYKSIGPAEARAMAESILMCDVSKKKFYNVDNNENIFYNGKIKKEYDVMSNKLEQTNEVEDLKIKCNTNLLKVEYIKKQTKQFINSINTYVSETRQHMAKCMEKYTLLAGAGANYYDENINSIIKNIYSKMLNNISCSFENFKYSFYEYENNYEKRCKIIFSSKTSFDEEKEKMNQTLNKCLCDKDGNPKNGKESDVEEIKDMMSKMKNIPEYSFACCEKISKIIDEVRNNFNTMDENQFLKTSNFSNNDNNLFALAKDRNSIENNVLKKVLSKNAINNKRKYSFYDE